MREATIGALVGLAAALLWASPGRAEPAGQERRVLTAPVAGAARVTTASTAAPSTPALRGLVVSRDPANRKQVLVGQLSGGAVRSLYESGLDGVRSVGVAADERYVAVLEANAGVVVKGEYEKDPFNRLVVLDAEEQRQCEPQLRHDDVYRYTFSPDGRRIAYLTGIYYEGAEGFEPTGGFVLDIPCCASATRARSCKRAFDTEATELSWIPGEPESVFLHTFDREAVIKKLDVRSGAIRPTELLSTKLSPDGAFQLLDAASAIGSGRCVPSRQDRCLRVLSTRDSAVVDLPSDLKSVSGVRWAPRGAPMLVYRSGAGAVTRSTIYDVAQRRVVEKLDGAVLQSVSSRSWAASPNVVVAPAKPLPSALGAEIRPEVTRSIQRLELMDTGVRRVAPVPERTE